MAATLGYVAERLWRSGVALTSLGTRYKAAFSRGRFALSGMVGIPSINGIEGAPRRSVPIVLAREYDRIEAPALTS